MDNGEREKMAEDLKTLEREWTGDRPVREVFLELQASITEALIKAFPQEPKE